MAGEIDTSIALRAGQPTVNMLNPLEVARQGAEYRNALLGNKIRQSEYDSKLAAGNALLGNTAADGSVNWDRARSDYARAARANPSLALGAADNFSANNTARTGAAQATDEELSFQNHARDAVAGAFIRAASNPTDANIRGTGAFIAHLTPQAAQQIATTTRDLLSLKTPEQRAEAIKTLATSTLGGHERIAAAFGTPTVVDDGSTIQSGTQGSALDGGAFTPAAGTQRQVSPEFNARPMETRGPDGSVRYVRQGVVAGTDKPTVPVDAMGDGRYPGAQQDFSGAGSAAQPAGYVASPPAGQLEAQQATAKAGAEGANALMQAASQRNDRLAMLGNMAVDLKGFTPGPGWSKLRSIQAFASNWGVPIDSGNIDAAQSFDKWAQNVANAQASALGHSDARLAAAEDAMPNSKMQKGTIELMLHQLSGNEDAINAKAQKWQESGLPAAQYQAWEQKFNQNFDPRAFQILRMTPSERETTFKGLKDTGQFDAFKATYNKMAAAGLVPRGR
ncbi:hypothetical protein J2D73_19225 [Acetobacter sacchari]|uniref:Uncharacterized protein n=1 Tax=Acetobacter sacchari TaxID=2661687 RepID=A0ABS3M162_9PROT|nr:hypothetical protein [Acetobacter sacchari]MBO1361918.1 hypothetical protein [Acetobacter sacchari]